MVGHHGRVPGIYDEPELYEAACAYRDVPVEVSALLRWSGKHGQPGQHGKDGQPGQPGQHGEDGKNGQPGDAEPHSVLDLAAGPAEHSRELARRGLAATTLDLSP